MKVRTGMLLGNLIGAALFVIVAIVVLVSANTVSRSIDEIAASSRDLDTANELNDSVNEMVRAVRDYAIARDKSVLDAFEEGVRSFEAVSERAKEIPDPVLQGRMNELISLGRQYYGIGKEVIEIVDRGRPIEAAVPVIKKARPVFERMKPIMREFHERTDSVLKADEQAALSAARTLYTVLIAGVIVSIGLAVGGAVLISSWIAKGVKESTGAVSAATSEIASTVAEHERTASAQSASVTETAATMNELGVSSKKVSEQAESATEGAKHVMSLAEEGLKTVEQTIEGMATIKEKSGTIAGEILKLSEQTAQIGSIANLVTDISSQINMLALNAAVEAVRAGEHGKGFNVIAQEVRKLADQARKSAERVNGIVVDIQKATNAAIMATEEGTKTIEEGAKLAERTTEAFSGVNASITAAFDSFRQISLNIAQQAAAIKQVMEAVNAITAGSKETAAGIAQTKVGIDRINERARALNEMV